MQHKTRSILEELQSLHIARDSKHLIENRANNLIASSSRLLDEIEELYDPETADILVRKLLLAIKMRQASKFIKALKKAHQKSPDEF